MGAQESVFLKHSPSPHPLSPAKRDYDVQLDSETTALFLEEDAENQKDEVTCPVASIPAKISIRILDFSFILILFLLYHSVPIFLKKC